MIWRLSPLSWLAVKYHSGHGFLHYHLADGRPEIRCRALQCRSPSDDTSRAVMNLGFNNSKSRRASTITSRYQSTSKVNQCWLVLPCLLRRTHGAEEGMYTSHVSGTCLVIVNTSRQATRPMPAPGRSSACPMLCPKQHGLYVPQDTAEVTSATSGL